MLGAVLALAASFCWGAGDVFAGLAGRRASPWTISLVSCVVGLVAGLFAVSVLGRGWPGLPAMVPALLAGFCLSMGMVVYFTALTVGTMSVVAPIGSACAVVPVAVGLARGEQPGTLQAIGVAAAVVGVGLAVYERKRQTPVVGTIEVGAAADTEPVPPCFTPRNRLGALLAVTAAILFGITLVGFAETARHDPFWPPIGGRITSVVVLFLLVSALRRRALSPGLSGRGPGGDDCERVAAAPRVPRAGYWLPAGARAKTVASGLLHVTAATLFSVASTKGLLSLVSVLSSMAAVFTVGFAFVFLGERLERQQLVGVVLAFTGVLLIAGG